jgi:RimJ/RimL family protein N-acetyltransferase
MDNTTLPETFTLSDGQSVNIRAIRPTDAPFLVQMFEHLSDRTRRLRFHSYTGNLPRRRIWREAIALSSLDPARQAALVAIHQDDQVVGVARFSRATADAVEAEAAIVVRDDFQRKGLGTHLLKRLLPVARSMGIERLFAWVMADNLHMLQIIEKANLPVRRETRSGETYVVITL